MINTTKIAKNNLKQNKTKSILIIITIVLSTCLLASVAMTCVNWIKNNKERIVKYSGIQHGIFTNLDENGYKIIENHADIEEVGRINKIGLIELGDRSKLELAFIDNVASKLTSIDLSEGKLPTKEDEIVLEDVALEKLGYDKGLGEKISLTYNDYSVEGEQHKEFILTGIIKSNEVSKVRKSFTGIVSQAYMKSSRDMSKEDFNVVVRVEGENKLSGEELKLKVEKIGSDIGIDKSSIFINDDYINAMNPDPEIITYGVVIATVVILSSILVIYNIFYLSIVTKIQEFGKLRAIGATKKQIKSIVLKEGIFLSSIAIPIGIVLGYVISDVILAKILFKSNEISKVSICIGVVAVSFITVYVSLLKPMKVASKISIIEALRYNGDNSKQKVRKGYSEISVKNLAFANLSRNKKRTYITILSLSLSGIIFITMSTVMNSIDAEQMSKRHFPYDIQIKLDNYTFGDEESPETEQNILQINNPVGAKFVEELKNLDGVSKIKENKNIKVELKGYKGLYKYHDITSVDEVELKDLEFYLQDGEIDFEKLKSGEEILISYPDIAKQSDIKAGDKITLIMYDGNQKIEKEFKVQGITSAPGIFAMHSDAFNKLFKTNTNSSLGVYVEKNKYDDVKNYIKDISDSNEYLSMDLIEDEIKLNKIAIFATEAIVYTLVVIIGAIGFINLINSMITSIITRKKELGMLQAMGLTNKQLVKMLNIESMFYTGIMLSTSLSVGNILGCVAFIAFKKFGASYAVYSFPLVQCIIMTIAVILSQLILTYLISKYFTKESLVDRVRYSE